MNTMLLNPPTDSSDLGSVNDLERRCQPRWEAGAMTQPRILIVENDRIVARDIDEHLTRLGYLVLGITQSGEGAVRLATDLWPDLVLMDIQLEGRTDGVAAAQTIRERCQVPVVFLTAYADKETLRRAKVTEPFGYLLKPFEERELHTVIEMALYKHGAERRLRESQHRYAVTLNSIGDAVLTTDTEGRVTFLNPVAEALTGWPRAEAIGRPLGEVFRVINAQTRAPAADPASKVLRLGTVVGLENNTVLLTRDGREVPIDDSAAPIIDEQGAVRGVVLVFHDVTERRRAAQSLSLFRALIDRTNDTIEVLDPDTGRFVDVNERACQVHGYAREEYLAMTVFDLEAAVLPDWPAWARIVADIRRAGFKVVEGVHRKKDGSTFPVEVCANFIRLDREYVVSIVRDITERKRAEEELRRSQRRYEGLVNSVDGIVWEADPRTFQFHFVSRRAESLLGYPIERWLAEPTFWQDHLHPDDRERALACCRAATSERRDRDFSYRMIAADGREVWLHDLLSVVVESDQVVALRGVMVDVTQQKRLEAQFLQAQKMDAVGRLAGGVAHDFNNLLTVINGYSEMLLTGLAPEDSHRGPVAEIFAAGERAAALTQQLLAFSRKQVLKLAVLNLNNVVTGMQKLLGRLIGEDIELVTRLDSGLGLVLADLGQLEQVILNLAVNARDAMPDGGQLILETANAVLEDADVSGLPDTRPGPHVLLTVSDTGCGMDAATQTRVFEPFFTTKEAGKGTGLGLATVYGIIKQSRGHVTMASEPGRGTTFKIYLPRAEDPPGLTACDRERPQARGGAEVVLLVEDDGGVRDLCSAVLRRYGYTVLAAANGLEALELYERHGGTLHLLVTDVIMPQMSGRQLAETLAAARPALKVLYLSGHADDTVLRHGLPGEQVAFLQKPFGPDALARAVRGVLDRIGTTT
jgi:PAS domain S-box-containing protein